MGGTKTGMWHAPGNENEALCVEYYVYLNEVTWIIKNADGSQTTIRSGTWLAAFLLSDHQWDLYKSGLIGSSERALNQRLPIVRAFREVRCQYAESATVP